MYWMFSGKKDHITKCECNFVSKSIVLLDLFEYPGIGFRSFK